MPRRSQHLNHVQCRSAPLGASRCSQSAPPPIDRTRPDPSLSQELASPAGRRPNRVRGEGPIRSDAPTSVRRASGQGAPHHNLGQAGPGPSAAPAPDRHAVDRSRLSGATPRALPVLLTERVFPQPRRQPAAGYRRQLPCRSPLARATRGQLWRQWTTPPATDPTGRAE
jgi:hypothetical protein